MFRKPAKLSVFSVRSVQKSPSLMKETKTDIVTKVWMFSEILPSCCLLFEFSNL